jgi:tripeptidyl-peptidase-2
LCFKPGQVHRLFLEVPYGATWAEVTLAAKVPGGSVAFFVHGIQLQSNCDYRTHEIEKRAILSDGSQWSQVFKLLSGVTLELTVAQYCTSLGDSEVTRTITFHGLMPNPSEVIFHGSSSFKRVDVMAYLQQEELQPSCSLKTHVEPLRPVSSSIHCLGEQHVSPNGCHLYQLILTYNFLKAKKGEVRPVALYLSDLLYESEYESQFWMLFDCNKQLILCGDAFPHKYAATIEKGEYTIRFQVCHSKREQLDRLKDMMIVIKHKLPSPVSLDVYPNLTQAMKPAGTKVNAVKVLSGASIPLYIMPPAEDKIPKTVKPGHILEGTVSFTKDTEAKKVDTYHLHYIIPESSKKSKNSKEKSSHKNSKPLQKQYEEALRSLQLSWAVKLKDLQLVDEVEKQATDPMDLRLTKLRVLEEQDRLSHLSDIVSAADGVLECIDLVQLSGYCGMKADVSNDADNVKQDMERKKAAVIETLMTKAKALADYPEPKDTDLDAVMADLQKWTELKDPKVVPVAAKHAALHGHYALAIKYLLHLQEEGSRKQDVEEQIIKLLKKLNWSHCATNREQWLLRRFPSGYPLF